MMDGNGKVGDGKVGERVAGSGAWVCGHVTVPPIAMAAAQIRGVTDRFSSAWVCVLTEFLAPMDLLVLARVSRCDHQSTDFVWEQGASYTRTWSPMEILRSMHPMAHHAYAMAISMQRLHLFLHAIHTVQANHDNDVGFCSGDQNFWGDKADHTRLWVSVAHCASEKDCFVSAYGARTHAREASQTARAWRTIVDCNFPRRSDSVGMSPSVCAETLLRCLIQGGDVIERVMTTCNESIIAVMELWFDLQVAPVLSLRTDLSEEGVTYLLQRNDTYQRNVLNIRVVYD